MTVRTKMVPFRLYSAFMSYVKRIITRLRRNENGTIPVLHCSNTSSSDFLTKMELF